MLARTGAYRSLIAGWQCTAPSVLLNLQGFKYTRIANVRQASEAAGYKLLDNMKDCYKLMNLSEDCDAAQLKEAYIKLAKQYHPDSQSPTADAEKFAKVQEAYRSISAKLAEGSNKEAEEDLDEIIAKDFDIRHTAPQHRQYLNFDGIGYGTPSQRQRQYQQHRASRANEEVYQYKVRKISEKYETSMVVKDKEAARQVKSTSAIHRLVEDLIRDSMEKGEFENLGGKGKPLRSDHNPLLDTMTHNLNKILINNGYTPEWITLNAEVRKEIQKVRENLQRERNKLGPEPLTFTDLKKWRQVLEEFDKSLKAINKMIDKLNMIVPTIRQQLPHMSETRR
ncbi:dnaJ homolog subfamily C member 28-like [Ptychodera flava]|uniref:dnaJ homolog subfamily C member 28-like n=1 Tax=Ptychodera flava TaxID=63121 RepID=UPI00396A90EC